MFVCDNSRGYLLRSFDRSTKQSPHTALPKQPRFFVDYYEIRPLVRTNLWQSPVYTEIGEPPAHDGLQASLDRVMAGLVSGGAELSAVLQDVRQGLSVVSAPPTALVRTLRGSRPAR
ncbi:hypothetical protein T4A_7029 [Trichinella pseudospiralis]|uniref:Uncharacterized protein n=1 Tax=Trichinella pseudospiralis TaxID=6337 RepID=A0A0V1DPW0_TRIPS|nr:hypothetical protein T4A_7029 [Trichinella pseudospiralis]